MLLFGSKVAQSHSLFELILEKVPSGEKKTLVSFLLYETFKGNIYKKYLSTYQALCFDQGSAHVRIHILQVPLEALALELLPQFDLLGEVADVDDVFVQQVVVAVTVEEVLVLVQPHLRHPGQVTLHRLLPVLGELVGVLPSEDVSHSGAGDDLDFPPAHPDLFKCSTWVTGWHRCHP